MTKEKTSKFVIFIYSVIFISLISGILIAGLFAFWMAKLEVPDLNSFNDRKIIQSTKIYDRTGDILLWDIHQNIQRTIVPFNDISRHIKNATIAIEDSTFYQHHGIKPLSILRSLINNIRTGSKHGGSTITQQLIKNTLLTQDKLITRKLKELIITLKAEKALKKEEILNLYLNEIPYGGVNYGVEAASQNYFGKPASDVTLAEAAYLAAMPQAPTYYSPYGEHRDRLDRRKNIVLMRMRELGFIDKKEEEEAKEERVVFLSRGDMSIKAPHFSIFIRSYLEEKYGKDVVQQNGLKVITTLDYDLQQKAEKLVKNYAEENTKKFNAYNAGIIAIDPQTGQIITMVGSRDWSEKPLPSGCLPGIDCKFEPKPNITTYGVGRQPGSAIKPFIYASALKKGYTPDTVVFDLKTEFNPLCNPDNTVKEGVDMDEDKCYMPGNYDHKYRGPTTMRNALAQSINIPAVKFLYLTGLKESIQTIKDMGISTINDPNRYGLTLVLGGAEVSLLEITGAYGVFANEGIKNNTTGILRIEDMNGKILEEYKPHPRRVLDKNIALLISDMLSDNEARTPAFGAKSWLYFPGRDVASKTGTTNEYRDAWVIGYTPNIAIGAWVGNNDNSSMEKKVAGFIVAPLWNAFFKEVLQNLDDQKFEKPKEEEPTKPFFRGDWRGGQTYSIDSVSGKLATEFTPKELIQEAIITQVHTILNWVDKKDPLGPNPDHPNQDGQFENWEKAVREWVEKQGIQEQTTDDIPKETDDVHRPELAPKLEIVSPKGDDPRNPYNNIDIKFTYQSKFGIDQVDFFFDSAYVGSSKKAPFNFSFVPMDIILDTNSLGYNELKETMEIKIVVYDKVKNKTEVVVPVRIDVSLPH